MPTITRVRTRTRAATSAVVGERDRAAQEPARIGGPDATDPRFRARREAVTDERRSVGRRRARAALAVLTAVALGFALVRSPVLDIDDITVLGASHTTEQQVLAATGLRAGGAMIDVDMAQVLQRAEAMPWVRAARGERSWWGGVTVEVAERVAFTQIVDGERLLIADDTGRVLEVATIARPELLTVEGSEAAEPGQQLGRRYLEVIEVGSALPPGVRSRVGSVRTTPGGAITLTLRSGGVVVWGTADRTDAKLRALVTILGQVDLERLCTLDVRVPATPVVTRC